MITPAALMGQGADRALLYSDGGTWLNSNPAPASSAIFADDLIRTQKGSWARIDSGGSTVLIEPETIVQFEGDELVLDHGTLQVNTWRGLRVRVDCLTVLPPLQQWARYDVTDVNGKVLVLAYQNDVKIHYRAGTAAAREKRAELSDVIVYQGTQATREEKCAAAAVPAAAKGALLNSFPARATGVVATAVIMCLGLCRTDDPISPDKP